jgi:hypothetical protein
VQFIEYGVQSLSAMPLKGGGIPSSQMPQMRNHILFRGQPVFTDGSSDEWLEDLLSAAPTNAKRELEHCPVDEWVGELFELANDRVQPGIPDWFVGHAEPHQTTGNREVNTQWVE